MGSGTTDEFGFRIGSKRARGAELAKHGTTQAHIKSVIGYTLHNMVTVAKERGHRVVESGDRFWLVHASDIDSAQADIEEIKQRDDLSETEKSACIQRRLRQGEFRRNQIHLWGGCAVSGCTEEAVLEACHIKRWKDFKSERLDAENGLCLTANLHKLFDAGLITFEDDGRMSVSDQISQEDQALLMPKGQALRKSLTPKQQSNLRFHREYHRK